MPLRTEVPRRSGYLLDPYETKHGTWVVCSYDESRQRTRLVAEFDGPDARREASAFHLNRTVPAEWRNGQRN